MEVTYVFQIPVTKIGVWHYNVTDISDSLGCHAVGTGTATITVNAKPSGVMSVAKTDYCLGDTAYVTINFTGKSPWSFDYGIPYPAAINIFNSSKNPFIIKQTSLGNNFNYQFSHLITDGNGCTQLGTGSAMFSIHALPTVVMSLAGNGTICDGDSSYVKFKFTGTGPWKMTYDSTAAATIDTTTRIFNNAIDTIVVTGIGSWLYTPYKVVDNFSCSNTGTGSAAIKVNPKPTATVSGGGLICSLQKDTILVALTGTAPWKFTIRNTSLPFPASDTSIINYNGPNPFKFYTHVPGKFIVTTVMDANCMNTGKDTATVVLTPLPTADFSAANVCKGIAVSFNNLSNTNGLTANWSWNFGDLTSSNSQNPTHTYATAQGFTIKLLVDINGCKDSISKIVYTNPKPLPKFSVSPTVTLVGDITTFHDSTKIATGSIASYDWNFGDMTIHYLSNLNVNHTYLACNSYDVTLIATSDSNCVDSIKQIVKVAETK